MRKKLFTLLLTLAASLVPLFAASGTCGDNLTWNLTDGVLTISGTGEMTNYTSYSSIPWYSSHSSIQSVIIPNGCTNIGDYAFSNCTSLTSVTIPNSVTSIGERAFYNCTALAAITIPNSVAIIGEQTFWGCTGLTSIDIPNSVTSIEDGAFSDCSSLTSINVVEDNANYCSIEGVLFNKNKTTIIRYPIGKQGSSYTIPSSVTCLGDRVFEDCKSLTSVIIPNSVTIIGTFTFFGCSGLASVRIPNSVTSIGGTAFCYVLNVEYNGIATRSPWGAKCINGYVEGHFVYSDASKTILLGCLTSTEGDVTIPNSVTNIGDRAFEACYSLTSVTIPNGVTCIGSLAFDACESLISVTIPNSVTSIGSYAFNACKSLISVTISNSVTSIERRTFYGCTKLTSVAIPNGVISIGDEAFYGCYSLTSVTIPNSVISIDEEAFYHCHSLTSVIIPNSVTSIGSNAFYNCSSLTSASIGNSVTSIGYDAFSGCSSLTSIEIPNSVTSIGRRAFSDCTSLTSVTIPNSVTSIIYGMFSGCSSLTSVTIPNSVTSIGFDAFSGCSSLTSIEIPNSVTSIEDVFKGCSSLTSVVWNATNCTDFRSTSTPFYFNYQNSDLNYDIRLQITSFVFGEDVEYIPAYLCAGMENAEIVIKNCKTEIGEHALDNCNYTYTTEKLPDFTITIKHEYDSYNSGSISYKIVDANYLGKYYYTLNGEKGCSLYNLSKGSYRLVFYSECGDSIVKNITINQYGMKVNGMYYLLDEANHTAKVTYRGTSYDDYNGEYSGNITIPKTITFDGKEYQVTGINSSTFNGCNNISSITMESEAPISMYSSGLSSNCIIYVPFGSLNAYKSASGWKNYTIHVINPAHAITTTAATSAKITLGNADEAKHISSCGMDGGEEEFAGNIIEYIGLEPNSEYANIPLFIKTKEGDKDNTTVSFTTTALELTTKPSKPVSSTTALLFAETNMSDAEVSCGFEWKRNDAPADMEGNKVYCPVASGQMAGRLKNLKDDVYYKYRAFYQSSAGNMYYGDWQYIFTGDVAVEFDPILYTYGATVVRENEATISGYALAGSEDFTEQGFEYWAETRANGGANASRRMPAALGEHFFVQASGISLRVTLTNLDAGTVYKYRVYGKVGDQYYYGSEQAFTTTGTYTPPTYTITFANWDGATLQSSQVEEGTLPIYTGATPERPEDEQYIYTFNGWSPAIVAATADATYTAQYLAKDKHEGLDDAAAKIGGSTKLLRDGILYIERNGKTYTVTGAEVK